MKTCGGDGRTASDVDLQSVSGGIGVHVVIRVWLMISGTTSGTIALVVRVRWGM